MRPGEDQQPRLHIARMSAVIRPAIDDDFHRLPGSLETLAEARAGCANHQRQQRNSVLISPPELVRTSRREPNGLCVPHSTTVMLTAHQRSEMRDCSANDQWRKW